MALPDAQVEIDRLLEPLSKGARVVLKNLAKKQAIPSNTITGHITPAGKTKTALDNKHTPMPIQNLNKNMMRKIDSKHELVNVAKERIHTETEFNAVPKQMPDRVTFTVNGEHNISSSSVNSSRALASARLAPFG